MRGSLGTFPEQGVERSDLLVHRQMLHRKRLFEIRATRDEELVAFDPDRSKGVLSLNSLLFATIIHSHLRSLRSASQLRLPFRYNASARSPSAALTA